MKKVIKTILYILVGTIVAVFLGWKIIHGNKLWAIVSQQCMPNQLQNKNPSPCIKVDINNHYALFTDSNGPYHELVIPTNKISGIESPELLKANIPSYFALAWENRFHFSEQNNLPIKNDWMSLAINSKYGRSQEQLHIHIACLRPDVHQTLMLLEKSVSENWTPLSQKIVGHQYIARKLVDADLTKEDPVKLLMQYVSAHGDDISHYGLGVVATPEGNLMLLASRFKLSQLTLGSVGEIQDYRCALAQH